MAHQPQAPSTSCAALPRGVLPAQACAREVQVRGALSRQMEPRSAVQVCEWMVEPVAGTHELSLTLVLSDNLSLSFVLSAEDAQDLGAALERLGIADLV